MPVATTFRKLLMLGLVAFAAAACATEPTDPERKQVFEETNDPLEPMNRQIFQVNLFLDHLLIGPLSGLYTAVIPPYIRDRIHDALGNLDEPVNFMNNALQAQFDRAGTTAGRFVINSTLGGAGFYDVATDWGLPEQHGDFGQTLWSWGVGAGPYLVLPLFGPSNPRDTVGMAVDGFADPWEYAFPKGAMRNQFNIVRFGVDGIDKRAEAGSALDSLEKTSIDFYSQLRSISRQYRAKQLKGDDSSVDNQFKDLYAADLYGNGAAARAGAPASGGASSSDLQAIYGGSAAAPQPSKAPPPKGLEQPTAPRAKPISKSDAAATAATAGQFQQ